MGIIIKQDELNEILNRNAECEGIHFLPQVIKELNLKIEIEGVENLPENGKCFFAANHPFGFIDGLILTNTVASKYGNFKAIGNEAFMLIPHIRPLIAAVNVFGTNPKSYLLELEKVYASDIPITHFPAGLVSRVKKRKIEDREWQKSFITKSIKHQRNIVPFYFYGRNSRLFYSIFMIRSFLGIKNSFRIGLLPREIFNKRNKTIKVKIGKPIDYNSFDNTKKQYEWAQYVKEQVYN